MDPETAQQEYAMPDAMKPYAGQINDLDSHEAVPASQWSDVFFEPVGEYIDRHDLEDVYAFAPDLPHFEGGKHPYEDLTASLKGQPDRVLRKFFVENAKAVLRTCGCHWKVASRNTQKWEEKDEASQYPVCRQRPGPCMRARPCGTDFRADKRRREPTTARPEF